MATVTGFTAARMKEIEDIVIVDAEVVGGNLILTKHDGTTIDAGPVIGPAGPPGPAGSSAVPGEVKLWPGTSLPDAATFGDWTWANGDPFDILTYPIAAANIDSTWNTANGLPAPAAGMFRVPDLRGMVPACLDALPVGSTRIGRMARPEGIQLAKKTGEEMHRLVQSELARHDHSGVTGDDSPDHSHTTGGRTSPHKHTVNGYYISYYGEETGYRWGSAGTLAYSQTDMSTETSDHAHGTYGASVRHKHSIGPIGTDTPHETVQPTVMVPYIVFLGV